VTLDHAAEPCDLCHAIEQRLSRFLVSLESFPSPISGETPAEVRDHALSAVVAWWLHESLTDHPPAQVFNALVNAAAEQGALHPLIAAMRRAESERGVQ
jgi:hypothetical protein